MSADREVAAALAGAISPDAGVAAPAFTPVGGELDPGDTVPVTVRLPVAALALPGPGLYPLVVEVNGTPGAAAGPARVAAVRTLLPVAGAPAAAGAAVSLLWPITDRPRRLAVPPGSPTLLADDSLAASFAPGGRLAGLVSALSRLGARRRPAAAATCLAVDADLLETAQDMSRGYRVTLADRAPARAPGRRPRARGSPRCGRPRRGRCVVALPYADADLLATSRGNMSDLTTAARTLGARRTAELLGVTPVPDATVPAGGLLDERSLADLTGGGARALVVDGATLAGGVPPGAVGRFAGDGSTTLALATDPLAAQALVPGPVAGSVPADGPLATQDALAVLHRPGPRRGHDARVLAPPPRVGRRPGAAAALLDGVGELARRGLVTPVDAGTLLARGGRLARHPAGVARAGDPHRRCRTSRPPSSTASAPCATTSATCSPRSARTAPGRPPRRSTSSP